MKETTTAKQTLYPNFILGIITFLMLFIGIGIQRSGSSTGFWIWVTAAGLGAIHWIWAIIDVFRNQNIRSQSRVLSCYRHPGCR
ncbi:hypothetical protein EPD60_06450 [Flaviaesturariibacter flavus]|uniref:Uncharacterized protein n=1 Tax=Flaviaesturariibacter flavus TaxID=2502780 RepID=A0A4R1BKI4_9BACT|nr:hypothetical protein [Flaviaesturariibacter flavus]TCJ17819.1 hypothetical protein EPD60_06450 [Flaviaesturariibacter flavus]